MHLPLRCLYPHIRKISFGFAGMVQSQNSVATSKLTRLVIFIQTPDVQGTDFWILKEPYRQQHQGKALKVAYISSICILAILSFKESSMILEHNSDFSPENSYL